MSDKRILLVEDEVLIALDTSDILAGAGYEVVGPAVRVETAVAMAASERLAGAVLDVNLAGSYVWPAARELQQRGVPFVFLTGFGAALDVPAPFASVPRLAKPIDAPSILTTLAGAIAAAARAE